MFEKLLEFIKLNYPEQSQIHLHEPFLNGNEKEYINECFNTNMVSSIGPFVKDFEDKVSSFLGAKYGIATFNGTSALHISLLLSGVCEDDEVITQSLTFIGTCNPIRYLNANPVFIDVDKDTLGLSPQKLNEFLTSKCELRNDGNCWNKETGKRIKACIPVHVNGFANRIDKIIEICLEYNIEVIEDAAEALGSKYKDKYLGTFGKVNALSFNGNKIITTGGGGMIITNDYEIALQAKHLTTQAKLSHKWEFDHDQIGYNYRLPNVNAAIGCAQIEIFQSILEKKSIIAKEYRNFFENFEIDFLEGIESSNPNFWLNTIIIRDKAQKNELLNLSHKNNIFLRPLWKPLHNLEMYKDSTQDNLDNTKWLYDRCISLPSSVVGL